MAAERSAEVTWQGSLMEGSGTIDQVGSRAFGPLDVSWAARSEEEDGGKTSPAQAGNAPEQLKTSATVTFVPGTGITKIALTVRGRVPGLDEEAFRHAAEEAKEGCPVSQALAGVGEITLDASLD